MHKIRDLKTHKRGSGERISRGGDSGGIGYIFVTACPTDVQEKMQLPWSKTWRISVCLIKSDTVSEVSANKQTIEIIRGPAAPHTFK